MTNTANTTLPEFIPLKTLFGNAVKTFGRVSPNGKFIAYLAENDKGVMNVFVKATPKADDPMAEFPETQITFEPHRSLRSFFWTKSPTANRLFYLQDDGGNEDDHLHCVDFDVDERTGVLRNIVVRDLTPFANTKVVALDMHRDFPDTVLVTMNNRTPELFDICSIDLVTGQVELQGENHGEVIAWYVTKGFEVAGCATKSQQDSTTSLWIRPNAQTKNTKEWNRIASWAEEEIGHPLMFNADASGFYVETSLCHDGSEAGTDKGRLALISTKDGKLMEVLASDEQCDVANVVVNDTTHVVDYAVFDYTKPRVEILNEALREDIERLQGLCHGVFDLISRSDDDSIWLYADTCDNESLKYYIYWRDRKQHALLFDTRPELSKYTLASMTPHVVKTSDNEDMVVYMSLPAGLAPENLPFVLFVHGGPWARDKWGYHPYHQLFANRGYGCLSVNFRGSTGYGKRWINLGNKQWGGTMQQDLTDAVHWIIDQGFADKDKVAIVGGSYGGYATLAGLTFTPELYSCGIDIVGPSNARTLLQSIPPYWSVMLKMFETRVGDVLHDDELNRKISPLFHADKICKPLLIIQGANDPRVKQTEADQIAKELFSRKHEVQYVVYKDEGHGCVRQPNVMDMNFRIEEFLADHLGGRKGAKDLTLIEGHAAVEIDPVTL